MTLEVAPAALEVVAVALAVDGAEPLLTPAVAVAVAVAEVEAAAEWVVAAAAVECITEAVVGTSEAAGTCSRVPSGVITVTQPLVGT